MTGAGPKVDHSDRAVQEKAVLFEVQTTSGRATSVNVVPREDTVEIWHHNERVGVFDRAALRSWFSDRKPRWICDGAVIFSIDRMVDMDGRIAISLPDVQAWALSPAAMEEIRHRV
jgi:hypothetical protein